MHISSFEKHLNKRAGVFPYHQHTWADYEEELLTFPLWTTTGKLVGYQQYNWNADKLRNNDHKGKYWTYRRKDTLTAWGLDCLDLFSTETLYIVEGVWDAISVINTGRRCLAVLANNPQQLKPWLSCLPCKVVALCDGDKAGKMLGRCADEMVVLPEDTDPNEMSMEDLNLFLQESVHEI